MSNLVTLRLQREIDSHLGTIGRLFLPELSLYTMERPWLNNKPWISCIPAGNYALERKRYARGGYQTWEIIDVPGRTHILIHKGNTTTDVQGCIAVGNDLGTVNGRWAVINSADAFNDLHATLVALEDRNNKLRIEITGPCEARHV